MAGGPSERSSWVGWEGVDCRAASRRELSVAACRCSANVCRRLLEAVEIVVGNVTCGLDVCVSLHVEGCS